MNQPYDKKLRGNRQCQCQGCYEYFTTVSGFDRHRRGPMISRYCLTTVELKAKGWTQTDKGFWMQPKSAYVLAHIRARAEIDPNG